MTWGISRFTTVFHSSKSRLLKIRIVEEEEDDEVTEADFLTNRVWKKYLLELIVLYLDETAKTKKKTNKQQKNWLSQKKYLKLFSVLSWLSDMPSVRVALVWTISSEAFVSEIERKQS